MDLGPSAKRRGFTFIEVMFAVLILGFGVIMIAAMLPVALRETQRTRDINAGSGIVEGGFHTEEMAWATNPTGLPATEGFPVTFPSYGWDYAYTATPAWGTLQHYHTLGNRVNSTNGAYAYIPFYSRAGSLSPQIAFLGVAARNVESMRDPAVGGYLAPGAFFGQPASTTDFDVSDNCPLPVDVEFGYEAVVGPNGVEKMEPDRVGLSAPDISGLTNPPPGSLNDRLLQAAVKGAALVLTNDNGSLRILRLGERDPDADPADNVWQLATGGDTRIEQGGFGEGDAIDNTAYDLFEFDAGTGGDGPYRGYLVGRMLNDPSIDWGDTDNPYVGPSQVVQVIEGQTLPSP